MSESEKTQVGTEDLVKRLVARYDYYYDNRTFSYNLRKTSKPKKAKSKNSKHALIVRRLIDERGRYSGTVIDIKSPALRQVLVDINENVEGIDLSRNEPEVSEELMYYSYPGLKARLETEQKAESRDENMINDIMAAILVVEEDQGKLMRDFAELTALNEISFDIVWALFKPNALVFTRHEQTDEYRVLIARRAGYAEREDRTRYLKVICDMIHDDGEMFGYAHVILAINEFRGVKKITDLEVYPLDYCPAKDDVYKFSVDLGKKFASMPNHSYHEMSGQAMRDRPGQDNYSYWHRARDDKQNVEKFYTSGRVMISPSAFNRFQPDSVYNPSVHRPIPRDNLTEDEYVICTPILLGFAFDRKTWGAFGMSRLRDVTWNDDAFRVLVLGEKQKTLIHGLVRQHASKFGSGFDDIIKGKGRGLIGLLAGTPGCGKTLTAEAVAEVTRRPLYAVSAGELGTTPEAVESRLLDVLELAQMWDAVLLLDEAEVFLQQRNSTNIKRNALVSIFLRQLEYYQGILILTTNMAEQCDQAFESRIHYSVHYPELDAGARKAIWATFFKKAALEVTEEELNNLAQHVINGRQIKNAFSSAQTIALSEGLKHLTMDHVQVVLGVLHDWQNAKKSGTATTAAA